MKEMNYLDALRITTERLAKGGIETPHRIQTPEDLIRVLRSGEYSLIETE